MSLLYEVLDMVGILGRDVFLMLEVLGEKALVLVVLGFFMELRLLLISCMLLRELSMIPLLRSNRCVDCRGSFRSGRF